ncbi:baeRF3 domain-containing protein [Streptomyces celluloflavus]|uniref:Chemotaxis protein n=1 Tax=Streptomyces celluloflavus TaxID=58344 RepID=A0ABW7RDC0_9ACTN|nr:MULTISPECIES: chemotaxis protein [Streptomyces]MYU55441.1 chemotaxis protein [Streptomyces sp. SID7805]
MHPVLSPAVLARLRKPRPYPAVSIVLPTHRREPDNTQDPIRLRNLLAEAKERLAADPAVTRERRTDVIGQLDGALKEIDLAHAEDGLVIFAAPGEHEVWSLGRTVPARVVLSDTFLTRNLVAAHAAEPSFWALVISADRISLWSGGAEHVTEHRTGDFPLTRDLEAPDSERKEQIGDLPSTFRDEQTRQFLRTADTAVEHLLASAPRPLYVLGEAAALSLLDEVGTVARHATAHIPHGGLSRASAEAVRAAVLPAVAAQARQEVDAVLADLTDAQGRQKFAAGIDEVWQCVSEGRVRILAVEEHYRETVRATGDHLVPAEPGDPDSRDDMVDEIVEQALETDARVTFVPDDTLAGMGRIACVLRY